MGENRDVVDALAGDVQPALEDWAALTKVFHEELAATPRCCRCKRQKPMRVYKIDASYLSPAKAVITFQPTESWGNVSLPGRDTILLCPACGEREFGDE